MVGFIFFKTSTYYVLLPEGQLRFVNNAKFELLSVGYGHELFQFSANELGHLKGISPVSNEMRPFSPSNVKN